MDKQALVESAIRKISEGLKQRGIPMTDYRTMPTYYGYRTYPLRVGIVLPSLKGLSVGERISITSPIARGVLSPEERDIINALLPFISSKEMNENFDDRIAQVVAEHSWPD